MCMCVCVCIDDGVCSRNNLIYLSPFLPPPPPPSSSDWYHLNCPVNRIFNMFLFYMLLLLTCNIVNNNLVASFKVAALSLVRSSSSTQVKAISSVEASLFRHDELCDGGNFFNSTTPGDEAITELHVVKLTQYILHRYVTQS